MNKTTKGQKHRAAVILGRLGGLASGPARMKKISPERRKEIATKASMAAKAKRIKAELNDAQRLDYPNPDW